MSMLRNSRGRGRGNVNQGPGGAPLKGWDFIQEKALSHDENMVADYADDIDTLLVFAGLFSAVLSAFLVVSIVLLQPDNSQTTVQLLSLIALRLPNGTSLDVHPFLQETAAMLPNSTVFEAPTNVAKINTLWFTSLVLSLAAALFGILAKQWCREYLRWHLVIASARENILARQVRFEAWERWQVGAFIAFIPAFLEIALVLFLVGLLIFVPTYSERSMTIVLSVLIGSILLGVLVLTILPVFFRLCPFQTPTGWAFVRLAFHLRWAFWKLSKWVAVLFNHPPHGNEVWRIRYEVYQSRRKGWSTHLWLHSKAKLSSLDKPTNWRAYGLHSVQAPELCKAVPAASDIKQACEHMDADFDEAAVDAVQTCNLFRALTWVRLGSNDKTVLAAIQEAVPTIHATISTTVITSKPHYLSAIHVICPVDVSTVLKMVRSYFYDISDDLLSFRAGPQSLFNLRDPLGPFVDTRGRGLEEHHRAVCEAWANHSASLEVSHSILRSDLSSLVDDWLALRLTMKNEARRAVAERIMLLMCMLRVLPSTATRQAVEDARTSLTPPWAETLEEVYQRLVPHRAAYKDGLVFMCVEMCRLLGPIELEFEDEQGKKSGMHIKKDSLFDSKRPENYWARESNLVSTWATLTTDIYRNANHYEDANSRHLFVTSVSRVFEMVRLRIAIHNTFVTVTNDDENITPIVELLSCMIDALRWSLVHTQANCGAYISLPWVKDILQCYEAASSAPRYEPLADVPLTGDPDLRPDFLLILRLLDTCINRDLIPRVTVAADDETTSSEASEAPAPEVVETPIYEFDRLLELLGHPELPDLPDDLTVEALEARRHTAVPPTLGDFEPSGMHGPGLPGEIVPEWPSSPAQASSRSISVDAVASIHIDEVPSDVNTNVAHIGGSSNGDGTEACPGRTVGENASTALGLTSITLLPAPASSSSVHLEEADVTIPPLSRPAHPQPESDTPPLGSPSSPPEKPGDDFDAQPGNTRTEQPLPLSAQSFTDLRDSPSFTYPPRAPSRLTDSDVGSPSLERARERAADTVSSSTMTNSQTASSCEAPSVAVPAVDEHVDNSSYLQEERARETGDMTAHTHGEEGDTCTLHTMSPSRTLDEAAPEGERAPFPEAGVTPHTHPENLTDRGPSIPLDTFVTSSANRDVPVREARGGQDTVAIPIDDTDRDLEAGPRIASPVDEDRGEV